ncbi:DJ-1/PfpI family protein [Candidatus Peregrinibacteria bacterium]|nr:MAG: DJ-1/PfpI family protein [Candidatus Peregrinibacteria bacterium]
MKRIVIVVAPENFRDSEYIVPYSFWKQFGASVNPSCSEKTAVGRFGYRVEIDLLLSEVREEDFDALFFVGGGGSLSYESDPHAKTLTESFVRAQKPVGAICAAPQNLLKWGLLSGKKCTGYNVDGVFEKMCAEYGAEYVHAHTITDGLFCTSSGPLATEETAIAFWNLISNKEV